MNSALWLSAIIIVLLAAFSPAVYYWRLYKRREEEVEKEKESSTRRLYELAILKELGERVGYSLNVEEILQIITGSLRQFIDYTAVAYMVIKPEKLKVNIHLEESVDNAFIEEMKKRMLASLSALSSKTYEMLTLDESVSGAIAVDSISHPIGSYFNIPLVIGGELAGILTIAHIKEGLYKEADMTILYKITNQASQAVSRLEDVVKMEKGKLNSMVESMGDGVLMVDTEYQVIVANPAVKQIIKWKGEKAITIFDFVDALGGKFDIHGRLEEAIVKKTPFISKRLEIDSRFFEIGVYPVTHGSSTGVVQILGAVVVFRDISRDIELERVREEFTSMIVHELRSPLDNIKKIIELVVRGAVKEESKEFKEYMSMVHQNSSSMLELVNDILDLSKLQAGKFEIHKEEVSPKDLIDNRISFYKLTADSKSVGLNKIESSTIPEKLQLDERAVKQVLNNFLSNSLKFTSQNGAVWVSAFTVEPQKPLPPDVLEGMQHVGVPVFPTIEDLKIQKNSFCVVVSDTGIGIGEGALGTLFHTYKQATLSPDKESKGTGLGLVIAKGIIEAHGGSVGVVSKEGRGTSFFFTIPM